MNKRSTQVCIVIAFLLTACAPTTATTPAAVTGLTETPSAFPTHMSLPTETSTPAITPLPTIPSFTPTFDASTIVTVTPAPMAMCPLIDLTVQPDAFLPGELRYPSANVTDNLLKFLNKGGSGQTLVERLDQIYQKSEFVGGYAFRDVTGDQAPELLYVELHHGGKPVVLSCREGKFEFLAPLSGQRDFDFYEMDIEDLNLDGTSEILITGTSGVSFGGHTIYTYGWSENKFSILGQTNILSLRQKHIEDVDGNGTKEILLAGDNPTCTSCSNFIPQRLRTVIYGWNGRQFVELSNEFTPPEYRFQAVQDADAAILLGNYEIALQSYLAVIERKELGWWAPERFTYEQTIGDPVTMFIETPSTIPVEDAAEYPRLAAYVYYRIMLLHFIEGNEQEAGLAYENLVGKFGADKFAQPYIEMATEFWNAYKSTQKMYDGCAAAIQYAAEHPEILIPLGSDYHGWQSHTYVPTDICPFR